MAWESKRKIRERLDESQRRYGAAREKLYRIGYSEHRSAGFYGVDFGWSKSAEGYRKESEAFEAKLASAVSKITSQNRYEILAVVIDALGIKGYAPSRLYDLFADTEGGEKLTAEQEALRNSHLDRFWDDIQTTLRVREERKRAEADAKTEERISGLAKPAEKATGGIVSGGGLSATLNSTVPVAPNVTFDTESLADAMAKAMAAASKKSSGKKGKQ